MGQVQFGEIVSRAELVSVFPVSVNVKRRQDEELPDTQEVRLDSGCSSKLSDDGSRLVVLYRFKVRTYDELKSGAPNDAFSAEIAYRLEYAFDPCLSEEHVDALEAFVEHNARFNCWPFLREFLLRTTAEMGLPLLCLPLLKPSALRPREERNQAPSGVDSGAFAGQLRGAHSGKS